MLFARACRRKHKRSHKHECLKKHYVRRDSIWHHCLQPEYFCILLRNNHSWVNGLKNQSCKWGTHMCVGVCMCVQWLYVLCICRTRNTICVSRSNYTFLILHWSVSTEKQGRSIATREVVTVYRYNIQ